MNERRRSFFARGAHGARTAGGLAAALFLVTGCSSSERAPTAGEPEETGERAEALYGGSTDANTAEANVVVQFGTHGCTGTLITPQVVVTAGHCVTGSENPAGPGAVGCQAGSNNIKRPSIHVGVQTYTHAFSTQYSLPKYPFCLPAGRSTEDVALLYLAEPVTSEKIAPGVVAPAVTRPSLLPPPRYDDAFVGLIGFAGYSWWTAAYGATTLLDRQVAHVNNAHATHDDDAHGATFTHVSSGWGTLAGDSGGPMFFVRSDGSRDPFAVLSSCSTDGTEKHYADITWTPTKNWLLANVTEGGVRTHVATGAGTAPAPHSDNWLVNHGKDLNSWWGELDYSGACDHYYDRDCDGWWDQNKPPSQLHDNCPEIYNPLQEDSQDLLSLNEGDACRGCKYDLNGDEDHDGVCERGPSGPLSNPDNCPKVYNPDQKNCNEAYERANGATILGDACDPVPCAELSSEVTWEAVTPLPRSPFCSVGVNLRVRTVQDEIVVHTIPPHRMNWEASSPSQVLPGPTLASVPTKFRYCQNFKSTGIEVDCNASAVLNDAQLDEGLVAADKFQPSPTSPWQRIQVRRKAADFPGESTTPISRDSDTGVIMPYQEGLQKSVYWDYIADDVEWHASGRDPLGTLPTNALCAKANTFSGTCLNGYLWSHAESPVGDTADFVGSSNVGIHGPNLANHIRPMAPETDAHFDVCWGMSDDPCASAPFGCNLDTSNLKYRITECLNCPVFNQNIARDHLQFPVILGATDPNDGWPGLSAAVADHFALRVQELAITRDVADAVAGLDGRRFVTAVETAPPASGQIDAIGVPFDVMDMSVSTQYLVADTNTQGGFYLDVGVGMKSGAGAGAGVGSSASRSSLSSVTSGLTIYSRTMEVAFLMANYDPYVEFMVVPGDYRYGSGTLAGSYEQLAGTITRPLSPYTYQPGVTPPAYLWTVEKRGDGRAHLAIRTFDYVGWLEPTPLKTAPLADDPLTFADATYALETAWDRPNEVLLTVSHSDGAWALFRSVT